MGLLDSFPPWFLVISPPTSVKIVAKYTLTVKAVLTQAVRLVPQDLFLISTVVVLYLAHLDI